MTLKSCWFALSVLGAMLGCGGPARAPATAAPSPAVAAPAAIAAPSPIDPPVAPPTDPPAVAPAPPARPFPITWMKAAATGGGFAEAVAVRADGSIIVAGRGLVSGWHAPRPSPGARSKLLTGFIAALDPAGAVLWARSIDGGDDTVRSVQALPDGAIVVCGDFEKTLRVDGKTVARAAGQHDAFVAALAPDGRLRWATAAGGAGYDACNDVAVAADGRIAIGGWVDGPATFGTLTASARGARDAFVAVLAADGAIQWVAIGGSRDDDTVHSVAITGDAIYATGSFGGDATFGAHALSLAPGAAPRVANPSNGFVVRYTWTGEASWATSFGTPQSFDRGWSITGLADGGVAVAGDVADHLFVARYAANGRQRWARAASHHSTARAVIALPGDELLVAAYFGWPQAGHDLELVGRARRTTLQARGSDTAIARYDADGELIGAARLAGETPHHDDERNGSELEIFDIARSSAGRIAMTGRLVTSAIVDAGDVFEPTTGRLEARTLQDTAVIVVDPPH